MSHKSTIKTELKNVSAEMLQRALAELDLQMVEAQGEQTIKGYGRMNVGKEGQRTFVISGFDDGYQAAMVEDAEGNCRFEYDDWNNRISRKIGENGSKVNVLYNAHSAVEQAEKRQFTIWQRDKDGILVPKTYNDKFLFQDDGAIKIEVKREKY